MMKRFSMLLVMCSAYAVLLGHSIVPHHHHETEADLLAHHASAHQHDHDHASLPNLLGHFVHAEDVFTSTVSLLLYPSLLKQTPVIVLDFSKILTINGIQNFPYSIEQPPEVNIYCFSNRKSSGLRGPPSI